MHHSGTSVVSNVTMMMGAFGGATEDLLLHPENPLKFWERRDVVALDEHRLVDGVQEKVAARYEVPEWVAYGFDASKPAARVHESDAERRARPDLGGGEAPVEAAHDDAIRGEGESLEELAPQHRRHDAGARVAHRAVRRQPTDHGSGAQRR